MGQQYSAELVEKIRSLGPSDVHVYINGSFSPHYRQHVIDTVIGAGANVVDSQEESNFVFTDAPATSVPPNHTVAFVTEGVLHFQG